MAKKPPKIKAIQRKIYFYKAVCFLNGNEIKLNEVFDAYIKLLNNDFHDLDGRGLATAHFEKYHILDIEKHPLDSDTYKGKFYSLRSTDFPYLFNMQSGARNEISNNDQDTLMEQTHFYCFTNQRLIASEYNFHGARIERLAEHLMRIMMDNFPSKKYDITIQPIVIPEYFEKIANCSSISKVQFKVAHPGLELLAKHKIIGATDIMKYSLDETSDFCVDIELSGGGRGKQLPLKNTKGFLLNIINVIKDANKINENKPDDMDPVFRKAKLNAYSIEEYKTIPYDLLDEKLVHTAWVDKVSNKSKYVDSDKMFQEVLNAYHNQKDEALKYMERI